MRGPRVPSKQLAPRAPGAARGIRATTASDAVERLRGSDARRNPDPNTLTGEGGEGGEGGGGARVPNLMPSKDMLERMVGGGCVDKLDGVEQGVATALNSKRWKYASFFNRMKRRVAQEWKPAQVFVRRDPTGRVYGTKDRVTVLEVSLKPGGRLARVIISKGSGIDFLDNEAIRAFRQAQPFPNPPKGLIDSQTKLITFSFGFHFQIDGRRDSWRIFRAR